MSEYKYVVTIYLDCEEALDPGQLLDAALETGSFFSDQVGEDVTVDEDATSAGEVDEEDED